MPSDYIQQPIQGGNLLSRSHITTRHMYCRLRRIAPLWSVDDDPHQDPGKSTGDRQSDDPTKVNPRDHAPVDGFDVPVAQPHPHRRTRDALRRRNRDGQPGRHHHRQGAA